MTRASLVLAALLMAAASLSAAPRLAPERLLMETSMGDMILALYPDVAPRHVQQILRLVRAGVYDGTHIYRIEKGFVAQLSSAEHRVPPLSPAQQALITDIPGEFSATLRHKRGTLSMARWEDPDSAQTSFSILLGAAPHLDGKYTIFGRLERGWEALAAIERLPVTAQNNPLERLRIHGVRVLTEAQAAGHELADPPPVEEYVDLQLARAEEAGRRAGGRVLGGLLLVVAALGAAIGFLAGRADAVVVRSLGMLGALVAFFVALVVLLPAVAGTESWGGLLFLATLGLVRMLSEFEKAPPAAAGNRGPARSREDPPVWSRGREGMRRAVGRALRRRERRRFERRSRRKRNPTR